MKSIKNYVEYILDDKDIIMLSKYYNGRPMFYHKYDVLIGPKEVIERYQKELLAEHNLKTGWVPIVRYI